MISRETLFKKWQSGKIAIYEFPAKLFIPYALIVFLFSVIALATPGWMKTSFTVTTASGNNVDGSIKYGMVKTCVNGICQSRNSLSCPGNAEECSLFMAAKFFEIVNLVIACIVFLGFIVLIMSLHPASFKTVHYGLGVMALCQLLVVALVPSSVNRARQFLDTANSSGQTTVVNFAASPLELDYSYALAVVSWIFTIGLLGVFTYLWRKEYVAEATPIAPTLQKLERSHSLSPTYYSPSYQRF